MKLKNATLIAVGMALGTMLTKLITEFSGVNLTMAIVYFLLAILLVAAS